MCPSSQRPQCVFQVEVPAARSAAATPLTVLPTLLTTRPRQVGTGVELAAKRYGADPRYQARARPRSLPSSGPAPTRPPRACICFEPCLLSTFRARAHAVHVPGLPRRHPAALPNAGQPSQDLLAWLKKQEASGPREQWTVSLPVVPLLRPATPLPLFCSGGVVFSLPPGTHLSWGLVEEGSRVRACLPCLRIAVFLRSVNAVVVASWATGHCLRPVWLSQRLK